MAWIATLGRQRRRVSEDPGRDGGEGDGPRAKVVRHLKCRQVAGSQLVRLSVVPAVPHGSDCVDDPLGRETVALGRLGVARFATSQEAALGD